MPSSLTDLAREGARVRLEQLQQEINSLYRVFPRLKFVKRAAPILKRVGKVAAPITGRAKTRKRRGWTAAQRAAVAKRMKAYWANRKRQG